MDGKYIEVIGENGCKVTTETCHKCSGEESVLAEKIKIIKNRVKQYKKSVKNELSNAIIYYRMREAEDILKILEPRNPFFVTVTLQRPLTSSSNSSSFPVLIVR